MQGKYPTFYVRSSLFQPNFNGQLQNRNIYDIYVIINIICHPLIELIISEISIQHSMLAFHNKNIDLGKNKCQGIFLIFMLASLVNLYSFDTWCINGWYIRHNVSSSPILYSTTTLSEIPTFMLELLGIYFSR